MALLMSTTEGLDFGRKAYPVIPAVGDKITIRGITFALEISTAPATAVGGQGASANRFDQIIALWELVMFTTRLSRS